MMSYPQARISSITLLTILFFPLTGLSESSLWKAASDRGTFYLLGSVHLLKASDYPLNPAIEDAYSKSDVLIFETDMQAMQSAENQQLLIEKAMLPGDRTLKDELDPEVYSALAAEMTEAGLTPSACQKFKPWFASLSVMLLRMQTLGLDPDLGLDQYFHRKATTDEKEQIGLEEVAFQINLFDLLSAGNQSAYTRYALKELEQLDTGLADMLKAWKTGDLEKLDTLVKAGFEEYPGLYRKFVSDRNRDWVAKLEKLSSPGKTGMVVVGVAHFTGPDGLVKLLEKKGYTIEQL